MGLGLGLVAGCDPGALTGFGGCFAAVLGFGRAAVAGLVGAWALAAAGLLVVGTRLGARFGGFPRGLGGGVLDEDVVVVVDEVVVVVKAVESEAEERAVGDGGGCEFGQRACARAFPGDLCVLVLVWWRCLGCAGTWVNRAVSIFAPIRVGAFARGSPACGGSIAGCWACPPP